MDRTLIPARSHGKNQLRRWKERVIPSHPDFSNSWPLAINTAIAQCARRDTDVLLDPTVLLMNQNELAIRPADFPSTYFAVMSFTCFQCGSVDEIERAPMNHVPVACQKRALRRELSPIRWNHSIGK